MDALLAKSIRRGMSIKLIDHTKHVCSAARALFGTNTSRTRLGNCWLRFFKLPPALSPAFYKNLMASCVLHDWGKANDSFQAAVRGKGEQKIRHEHFSALLIAQPEISKWLADGGYDVPLVLAAVLTHHLKASGKADGFAAGMTGQSFGLVTDGLQEVISFSADTLGIPLNADSLPKKWGFGGLPTDVRAIRTRIQNEILEPTKKAIRDDITRGTLLSAIRAGLIVADAAGSGLIREGKSLDEWIDATFDKSRVWTKADVWTNVIEKRVADVERQKQRPFKWNAFQSACDDLPDRALLLAPCGSGKTLAAWRWIAAQLDKREAAHALFLYPTRGTAREGFKDYVSWAPEADAGLMHGTSEFDLAGMFTNLPDGDERRERDYEAERRLFALAYWSKRAFSATVDQFLAFMQYSYGPLCMLPVLSDSVVVIDEVHSFDTNMFAALKDFLRNFDVPVLCMTATLPISRRDELIACGLTPPAIWPEDLLTIARMPRYRLHQTANRTLVKDRVRDALHNNRRVLWVVNQVRRAHAIVREFAFGFDPNSSVTELNTADGKPVICYHSRFRLSDRMNRHAETMKALKDLPGPALGVTTQVCEMSLDIDVDLLVTEECPVTSLVQRMGRCNRDGNARSLEQSGEVLVYPAEESAPYSPNDLKGLPEFLEAVAGKHLTQEDIETALIAGPCPDIEGDPLSRFLTSGPYAVSPKGDDGEGFREGNDFNRLCILSDDISTFNGATPREQPGFVVPVPRKMSRNRDDEMNAEHRKLPAYLGVAESGHYHPAVGFCDFPLAAWSKGGG